MLQITKDQKEPQQADLVKLFLDQKIQYKNRQKDGKSMVVRTNDGHKIGQDLDTDDGWLLVQKDGQKGDGVFG